MYVQFTTSEKPGASRSILIYSSSLVQAVVHVLVNPKPLHLNEYQ